MNDTDDTELETTCAQVEIRRFQAMLEQSSLGSEAARRGRRSIDPVRAWILLYYTGHGDAPEVPTCFVARGSSGGQLDTVWNVDMTTRHVDATAVVDGLFPRGSWAAATPLHHCEDRRLALIDTCLAADDEIETETEDQVAPGRDQRVEGWASHLIQCDWAIGADEVDLDEQCDSESDLED